MMVNEYMADNLADNLAEAERAAERKLGKCRKKRTAEAAVGK